MGRPLHLLFVELSAEAQLFNQCGTSTGGGKTCSGSTAASDTKHKELRRGMSSTTKQKTNFLVCLIINRSRD